MKTEALVVSKRDNSRCVLNVQMSNSSRFGKSTICKGRTNVRHGNDNISRLPTRNH